jgi:hypothetical protein
MKVSAHIMHKKPNGRNTSLEGTTAPLHWATIFGKWSIRDPDFVYEGSGLPVAAHGQQFPFGLIVSNRTLQSGSAEVAIKFPKAFGEEPQAGGVVIGFRSQEQYYVLIQLGAAASAYSISESVPGFGWRPLMTTGPRDSLKPGNRYELNLDLRGQELRVRVNDVQVLEQLLPRPLEGRQVGLVASGSNPVQFSGFGVAGDRRRAFIAMEYKEPYDTLYREVIKPSAEKFFDVFRMDEKAGPGVIIQDMQREIAQSDLFIAEVTPANPNVFYELGYAHALGKPTILLAQRKGELPFDIRSYRVVYYDDTIGGKSQVERDLQKHLEAINRM